jgi:hypothetical protein
MSGPEGMDPGLDHDDETPVPQKASHFERLKTRRERIGSEKTRDFIIPGYAGELLARYRLLEWQTIRNVIKRMEKSKGIGDIRELYAQCDTLIIACEGLYYKDFSGGKNGSGELKPLMDDHDNHLRYDIDLARMMEFEATTARQVVLLLFKNDLAIAAHHGEVVEWMQGASPEADEEFLGESLAPRQ